MDAGVLYRLFEATVHPDHNVRMQAELELRKAEESVGFLPGVLQILGTSDANVAVRQAAAIYFKNRLQRGWDPESKKPVNEGDKLFVRQHILRAIVELPANIRVQLITCLGRMLQYDYAQGLWPQFLQDSMNMVQAQDQASVYGGLAAVQEFVKCFQWAKPEKRQFLDELIERGLPILHSVGTRLVPLTDVEAGDMLKTILKTYNATIRMSLSKTQQESSSLVPWGTLFVQVIEKTLPIDMPAMPADALEREKHPWWKAKKWAYSCLNTLFERYGRKPEKAYHSFSIVFMEHFAPNILNVYMKQIEQLVSGVWMSARVKQHLADFVTKCVKPVGTWNIIKPHLEAIILQFVFPLLCFNEEDEELWNTDPVEYVHKKIDNPLEDFRSPVHAVETLLFDIAKLRSKTFVPIVSLINTIIARYEETSQEQRNPRHKDGALKMMSCLAPLALDNKSPIKGHLEQFIVTHVLPELKSSHAFLRARACETLLSYEGLVFENEGNQQMAFRGVLDCLVDSDLPVRVSAALALRIYLKIPMIYEAMKPHVQSIIQALMNLTNEVDMETLTQVLETLVADYSEELAPFAIQLATQLRDTFVRLMAEVSTENEDMEYDESLEEKTAAAQGVLRTLCTLVLAMEASPQISVELEVIVAPALTFVLQHNVIDLYDETFDIIETTTFCAKAISRVMWDIWPLIYQAFKTDAVDYIDEMANCLENYVSFGKETFAQSKEHQEQIYDIIQTVLREDNEHLTDTNRSRACDLIEAILLNLRGHVDVYVPRFLELALPYIQKSGRLKKAGFKVRCLEVVINGIYYNPAGTLVLLEQKAATAAVLEFWFKNLGDFKRVHDKKLCILALLAILDLPLNQIPPSLQGPGWTQVLLCVLQVFESYPEAIQAREAEEKMYAEGLDDEDEQDVEEDEDAEIFFTDAPDDDCDVLDDDDKYLEMLAHSAAESRQNGSAQDAVFEDDDDDWDVEELEEDVFFTTPLDHIEAYSQFERTMQRLAGNPESASLVRQALNAQQHSFIEALIRQAAHNREKKTAQ
ncbi:uncharacterized protein SPPG_08317 [Spizellomyces punctatus DAOM BR117]|uniref:Importin N-terminal domain-containing protein n=1 Tax=Spizellomyces punctatus (strain DAOM BR117) TaxID=645134 RepID=A0A0L0H4I1_SPIPD|nr:uncharacterized protein SPPG_08317 [Spizellomyces punctatus DAOM BR117]KNC96420.1 hypothetical protein SPPG_08317 [Spizellomyces punctatus DAOM BR117]|eukprot:XP_016604460.1 hypothetical protein SPPG_08317 [Spizellomyces punctatus DAOM BR117]